MRAYISGVVWVWKDSSCIHNLSANSGMHVIVTRRVIVENVICRFTLDTTFYICLLRNPSVLKESFSNYLVTVIESVKYIALSIFTAGNFYHQTFLVNQFISWITNVTLYIRSIQYTSKTVSGFGCNAVICTKRCSTENSWLDCRSDYVVFIDTTRASV